MSRFLKVIICLGIFVATLIMLTPALATNVKSNSTVKGVDSSSESNNRVKTNVNTGDNTAQTDQSVNINQEPAKIPVNSARGTPVQINGPDCQKVLAGGYQGLNLGLSFGLSLLEKECQRNQDAAQLYNQGLKTEAKYRHCESKMMRLALEAANPDFKCPESFYKSQDVGYLYEDPNSP